MPSPSDESSSSRGPWALALWIVFGLIFFIGFVLLGTWQVHRLGWKRELIQRVDSRVHASPEPAPTPAQWPAVTAERDEYRHVTLQGTYLYDKQVQVWTSTDYGSGFWLMTPLREADGGIVFVNRGFAPVDACKPLPCQPGSKGQIEVTGLLRLPETPGLLRHNDPAADRWYVRDLAAMAQARQLGQVAPFFVDADAAPGSDTLAARQHPSWPLGGLTVVSFRNNHLSYAITWFALALMTVFGVGYVIRDSRRKH